jgi:hypothetical protein
VDLCSLQPKYFTSGPEQVSTVLNSNSGGKYLLRHKMKSSCQIHVAKDLIITMMMMMMMMIYLFITIELTPGGSITLNIYTQTIQRTTQ